MQKDRQLKYCVFFQPDPVLSFAVSVLRIKIYVQIPYRSEMAVIVWSELLLQQLSLFFFFNLLFSWPLFVSCTSEVICNAN